MTNKKPKKGYKLVETHYRKIIEIPEEWEVTQLGKICKIRKGNDVSSNLYVGLEHLGQGNNLLESRGVVEEFISTKNIFHKNDVLYGKLRPLLNKIWLANESGFCSTDILPLISNKKIIPQMLLFLLSQHSFFWYAVGTSAGTKMPRTNWSDIKKFNTSLPSKKEQEKIVLILYNISNLIKKYDSVILATKNLHESLIQHLLTKGIGHKKFKKIIFSPRHISLTIPEEWKTEILEKFLINKPQNGINIKLENYGQGVPIFEIDSLYESEFIINQSNLRCVPINDEDELEKYRLKENDFLINRVSKVKEGVGKMLLVLNPIQDLIYEGNLIRIQIDNDNLDPKFLELLSKTKLYSNYIQSTCKTTSLTSVDQGIVMKIPILMPPIKEQIQIIEIFEKLKLKIDYFKFKKTRLLRIKKGLIQKLLTGEIRLKL